MRKGIEPLPVRGHRPARHMLRLCQQKAAGAHADRQAACTDVLFNDGDLLRVAVEHPLRLPPDGGHNQQIRLCELTERSGRQREPTLNRERTTCLTEAISTESLPAGTTQSLCSTGQDLKGQRKR
ncbi:MAG: hypothetical protein CM15mP103_07320 [Gammaproteobacteria bacterium]|nr:MAG: hypothetical protein CM15mP103_07320 [Gammaproteobacteria bacterium]